MTKIVPKNKNHLSNVFFYINRILLIVKKNNKKINY